MVNIERSSLSSNVGLFVFSFKILFASKESLAQIKEMHIEFHTHPSQSLSKLIELLEKTHRVELFKGTQVVSLKKATGLVQIRASLIRR